MTGKYVNASVHLTFLTISVLHIALQSNPVLSSAFILMVVVRVFARSNPAPYRLYDKGSDKKVSYQKC